ncbi:MAG: ABC transporter substrate-binding protein, partial [Anaerolineales bacterium]
MRKHLFGSIALLMVVTMVLGACTPEATPEPTPIPPTPTTAPEVTDEPSEPSGPPDLTGETITLYHFGDLSGPYAAITAPLVHGAEDAVAALNAAGGIYGATLEVQFADTAGSIDEAVA